jgi:hypothetical protein
MGNAASEDCPNDADAMQFDFVLANARAADDNRAGDEPRGVDDGHVKVDGDGDGVGRRR